MVIFSLFPEIFNSIHHAIFVSFLIVILVIIYGFNLFFLRGVSYFGPDVDGHQLHGVKVGGLETTAHGESAFAHVVALVEVGDVAITHATFFVAVSHV